MGDQSISQHSDPEQRRRFTQKLLADLRALERMLEEDLIESDTRRIGAEQEVFLVDKEFRPAPVAPAVLDRLEDERFTTELGRFNMEFNLDPVCIGGDCLRQTERQLVDLLGQAQAAAAEEGARVVLTGILPTLEKSHLDLGYMTPKPRYYALNDAMNQLRGGKYQLRIKGRDELILEHDNVMLEACNTSFQVHFQVTADEFARKYNIAQAVAGPLLATATNSPLLFGRQLWRETRIALFQQSVDTRGTPGHLREIAPRVSFGRSWVDSSALEIFREDIARFQVLLGAETEEDSLAVLDGGGVPGLRALRLHNGTIYRWNRPCYGISDGKPHLRIENRVLPSGPTPLDEMANAAFWLGLMSGVAGELGDITGSMEFAHARENFVAAARLGLGSQLRWPGRGKGPARELILEELLPLARAGLADLETDAEDIDRYLGVIEERTRRRGTGSSWLIRSLDGMKGAGSRHERLVALVSATCERQGSGVPVHQWQTARLDEAGDWRHHYQRVEQLMTTDLFTVHEDELVDMAAYVMDWKHIRHVPVEDNRHRLVGLVTHRALLRLMAKSLSDGNRRPTPVSQIMQRNVVTARPGTPTREAMALMKREKISCLPVVEDDDRLVGIVTERDFMGISGQLLDMFLAGELEEPNG